jgi:hypothetical protein
MIGHNDSSSLIASAARILPMAGDRTVMDLMLTLLTGQNKQSFQANVNIAAAAHSRFRAPELGASMSKRTHVME